MRYKLIKFAAVNQWKDGTVIIEVNLEMCDSSGKFKRRKGDAYTDVLHQLWAKYGNFTFSCPMKKVKVISFYSYSKYLSPYDYLESVLYPWNDN